MPNDVGSCLRRNTSWSGRLAGFLSGSFDDAEDVALLHDQEILAVEAHLGAGPLAEKDAVAFLDVQRNELAGLVARAGADGQHLAFLRLLLELGRASCRER